MTQLTKEKIEEAFDDEFWNYYITDEALNDKLKKFLHQTISQVLKEVVGEEMMRHNPSKELRDVQVIAYMEGYNQAKQEITKRIKEMGYKIGIE